ncbi:tetratricopeptide repeat protein [bacterium]|nr:tetratricopeptide repeat protein [bacterium]
MKPVSPTPNRTGAALALLILLVPGLMAHAQIPYGGKYPPFALTVQPAKTEYWTGEPIVATTRIVNWLGPAVRITAYFGLAGAPTRLSIIDEGIPREPYRAYHNIGPVSTSEYFLQYGKAHEFRIPLLYEKDSPSHLAFEKPGEYRLRLEQDITYQNYYHIGTGFEPYLLEGISRPLQVIAPPPEGRAAFQLLRTHPLAFRDMNRLLASPGYLWLHEKIWKEHPETPYAPWCLHAAATLSDRLGEMDPAQFDQAKKLYAKLLETYPDYPFRDQVRVRLAELLYEDAQVDRAVALIEATLTDDEDNLYRFRHSPMMKPIWRKVVNRLNVLNILSWQCYGVTRITDTYFQLSVEPELAED